MMNQEYSEPKYSESEYSDEELKEWNEVFHRLYPNLKEANLTLNDEQLPIIRSVLSGKDSINILQTGAGKSACYLVPAMLLPGITIVVSPLISLIEDQVMSLTDSKIPVACITGSVLVDRDGAHHFNREGIELTDIYTEKEKDPSGKDDEKKHSTKRMIQDHGIFLETILAQHSQKDQQGISEDTGYKILYVTPERLRSFQFIRFAERANISLIAIDEAHCVSLWGYEFRKRYLEIQRFFKRIGQRPIVAAFTATATAAVKADIEKYLALDHPVINPPTDDPIKIRKNLHFSVQTVPSSIPPVMQDEERLFMILEKCRELLKQFSEENKTYCIMIYCLTVNQVKTYYRRFREDADLKEEVTRYYADLDSDSRHPGTKQSNWESFLHNYKRIMITTSALGMGVDKSNIRYVIHAGMPTSLENYYQEAGRAGRFRRKRNNSEEINMMKGDCILYCVKNDYRICRLLNESFIDHGDLTEEQKGLRSSIANERLSEIMKYCDAYLPEPVFHRERPHFTYLPKNPQQYIVNYFNNSHSKVAAAYPNYQAIVDSFQKEVEEIDVLIVNRTFIAQRIRKGEMSAEDVLVGTKKTSHTVSYQITGGEISYLDMMVADAVYTLFKHGQQKIYARHVAQLLSGDHDIMLTPSNTSVINASLRKLSQIRIRIDMTNSVKMGFFYDDEMDEYHRPITVLEGAFLPLEERGNSFVRIDKMLPPLYHYAEIMHGQFHAFSLSLLKVMVYDSSSNEALQPVKKLPFSWTNIAMTHYLLRRIDTMHRGSTASKIKRETMMEVLEEFFTLEEAISQYKLLKSKRIQEKFLKGKGEEASMEHNSPSEEKQNTPFQHSSSLFRKIREIKAKEIIILTHLAMENYISLETLSNLYEAGEGKNANEAIPDSIPIKIF